MSSSNELKYGSGKKTCKIDNTYSILNDKNEGSDSESDADMKVMHTPSPVSSDTKWGDIMEPDEKVVMRAIDKNLDIIDDSDEKLSYLSSIISKSLSKIDDIVNKEKANCLTDTSGGEKVTVRNLHELTASSNEVLNVLDSCLNKIRENISSVDAEKTKIIDGWNNIINGMNTQRTQTVSPVPDSNNRIVTIRQPFSYLNAAGKNVEKSDNDYLTAGIGKVAYTGTIVKGDNVVSIKFNKGKKCYVIKLDGRDYSFTDGAFIQRDRRNPTQTVIKYGKRCDPKRMRCNGATCTYYHDPLKTSQHGHTTRNLAMSYITEELIKNVSDDDYIANITGQNPYLVEDIVQLAGMLLLKAATVKKILG
jgi:hypothetical protein